MNVLKLLSAYTQRRNSKGDVEDNKRKEKMT